MKNPWTKKNPLMSIWLSAAHTAVNSAAGSARGHAAAASKQAARKATTAGSNAVVDFWMGALKPPAAPRKRRKPR